MYLSAFQSSPAPTQRSGAYPDPETLKQGLEVCQSTIALALQAKPDVQEAFLKTAQQVCQAKQGSSHLVITLYQDPAFRQWLFGIFGVGAGVVALNKNAVELWKIFTERNRQEQKKIQDNLNITDLDMITEVSTFCRENLKPLNWKKEGERYMNFQEKFKTAVQAQLASGENWRGSSVAKTAYANVTTHNQCETVPLAKPG
jgi:hypothetical protein